MKHKKISLAIISACLLGVSNVHADSIDDQMRDTFNLLINPTPPNAYNNARRGVLFAGSLFIKSPTKRTSVMSSTAPSFSAGCGGIDFYGGSFSFINKDEFIETFQAIGANALGYGVKLAVQSACPSCEQVMTSLEKTAQFINSMNVDSCQAAQGIVNAGDDFAISSQTDTEAKNYGVNSGQWEDLNEAWSWTRESGESPTNAIANSNPSVSADKITLNAVWRSAKESDVQTAFGGDDKFLEMLMTMTGTIIIKNPSNEAESDPKPIKFSGQSIKLSDLITGGKVKVYDCDTTTAKGCLNLSTAPSKEIDLKKGLQGLIFDSLLGDKGIIQSYRNDKEWEDEAKKALSFSGIIAAKCIQSIHKAAANGAIESAGVQIAQFCSQHLSLELAFTQVTSYIQTTRNALSNLATSPSQEGGKKQAMDMLDESYEFYEKEFNKLGGFSGYADKISVLNEVLSGEVMTNTITGG